MNKQKKISLALAGVLVPLAIASIVITGFPPRLFGLSKLNETTNSDLSFRLVYHCQLTGWQDGATLFSFKATQKEIDQIVQQNAMVGVDSNDILWYSFEKPYWWSMDKGDTGKVYQCGRRKEGMFIHYEPDINRAHLCQWVVND